MKVLIVSIMIIISILFFFKKDKVLNTSDNSNTGEKKLFLSDADLRGIDKGGSGSFGAPRGNHSHKGLDILSSYGSVVLAPFDCVISRLGYVYNGDYHYKLIEVVGTGLYTGYKCKIMYAITNLIPSNKEFKQGQKIGTTQNISKKYNGVKNHLHYEVYSPLGLLINPEAFI